jgi:hypothetical protein
MRTETPSRAVRALLCIGALIFTMSAAGATTPTLADEAKLQALQQQLDELNQQLERLETARAAAAQRQPMQTRWSMQDHVPSMQRMPGMGARACGAAMMMGPSGSMWTPSASASLPEAGSRGAQLVNRYCAQCHAPPSPSLHTQEEWAGVTQRMRGHIGELAASGSGVLIPNASDLNALTQYLGKHASDRSLQ